MEKTIRCAECEYCKEFRPEGNTRSNFTCEHPDTSYIREFYKKNKISRMEGFIGFGKRYSSDVPIKTSPKWCPKKQIVD